MKHGEQLAPLIEQALARGRASSARTSPRSRSGSGPGPFTGLRVGLVTARTLGFVLEIPVYGVCSLDVLAVEAVDTGAVADDFVVATDARRKEVYLASYDATRHAPATARSSTSPAVLATDAPVVGEGARALPRRVPARRRPGRARAPAGWPAWWPRSAPSCTTRSRSTCAARRGRARHAQAASRDPPGRARRRRRPSPALELDNLGADAWSEGAGRRGGQRRAAHGHVPGGRGRRRRSSGTPSPAWWPTSPSCSGSRSTPRTGAPASRPRCSRAC